MGKFFTTTKSVLLKESDIVADIVYTLVIMFLNNNNDEYADELMEISKAAMDVIKNEDVGIDETVFHEDLEMVIGEWLDKQDVLVKAALDRLFHRAFSILDEHLDAIDVDNIISEDEKKAWINLFKAIYDAAKTTRDFYSNKK